MKQSHIHKYKRVLLGGKKVERVNGKLRYIDTGNARCAYRCIIPGCKHKVMREEMEGRETICWNCGGILIITSEMLTLAKPRHFGCRKKKTSEEVFIVANEKEDIFKDIV